MGYLPYQLVQDFFHQQYFMVPLVAFLATEGLHPPCLVFEAVGFGSPYRGTFSTGEGEAFLPGSFFLGKVLPSGKLR